jgi:hypothetical protein
VDIQTLFADYYTQYRGQAQVPAFTDPEYTIFISYAREAIGRWASYDNTYWRELFTKLSEASDGDSTIVLGQTAYACPSDMKEVGGYLRVIDPTTGATARRYMIIDPNEAQFKVDSGYYCYFTGDPQNGFTMTMNPTPDSAIIGFPFDYVYYKLPTFWDSTSQPTDTTEMSEPYFIVHRALAARFRSTRNPYYNTAKGDGEDVLKIMQMNNNSGSWANPWQLEDNTGTQWGIENAAVGY